MFISRRHNGWHAEDDLDVIPVHFDPSDHHSDDVACPMPIERIQSLVNFVGEILQTANNQCQILFGFGGFNVNQRRRHLFERRHARRSVVIGRGRIWPWLGTLAWSDQAATAP